VVSCRPRRGWLVGFAFLLRRPGLVSYGLVVIAHRICGTAYRFRQADTTARAEFPPLPDGALQGQARCYQWTASTRLRVSYATHPLVHRPPHRTERLDVRRLRDPARSVACASSSLMPTTPRPKKGKRINRPAQSRKVRLYWRWSIIDRGAGDGMRSKYLMRSGAVVSLFVYLSLAVRGNHDDSINSFQTTRKNIGQQEGSSRHFYAVLTRRQASSIACHSSQALFEFRSLERFAVTSMNGSDKSLKSFHSFASASQYSASEYSISFLASAARSRHMSSNAANCFLEYIERFPLDGSLTFRISRPTNNLVTQPDTDVSLFRDM
jgi:hypothetical protein